MVNSPLLMITTPVKTYLCRAPVSPCIHSLQNLRNCLEPSHILCQKTKHTPPTNKVYSMAMPVFVPPKARIDQIGNFPLTSNNWAAFRGQCWWFSVQSLHCCDFSKKGPFSTSTRHSAFPSVLLPQRTFIFLCFATSITFVLLKPASPFPICMHKSVSRLVCTNRFSLKIKLFEFRRFSSTCLDRYQQRIRVIANAHFPEINHISLCDWNVWIQNLYSTQLPSLSLASHFVGASAQHAQVVACFEISLCLSVAWPFLAGVICCFPLKSLIPSFLSAVYVMQQRRRNPSSPLCPPHTLQSDRWGL